MMTQLCILCHAFTNKELKKFAPIRIQKPIIVCNLRFDTGMSYSDCNSSFFHSLEYICCQVIIYYLAIQQLNQLRGYGKCFN